MVGPVGDERPAGSLMPSPQRVTEEWEFAPEPASTRDVRRRVVQVLEGAELHDFVASASLVVSELATNAVLHARTVFTVRLRVRGLVLRIEVQDGSRTAPVMRNFSNQATSGRGLRLVEGLSRSWGVEPAGGGPGTVVWAEIEPASDEPQVFDFEAVDEL